MDLKWISYAITKQIPIVYNFWISFAIACDSVWTCLEWSSKITSIDRNTTTQWLKTLSYAQCDYAHFHINYQCFVTWENVKSAKTLALVFD